MTTTTPNTSELYWDVRGAGPAVLLIAGTPGDAGQFEDLASALTDRRTVVSYDRRGTSRSPSPAGWTTTSVAEQADDAAAVLTASGGSPALVYGTSNGAAIALELARRHPALVRAAVLHEMPLISVLADPGPVAELVSGVIGAGMADGGTRGGLQAFLEFAFGPEVVDGWSPALRERMLANADMVFGLELPAFQSYRPDESALAAITAPIHVVVGAEQQAPFFREAAQWLAGCVGTSVQDWPGAHGPQFTCPSELADAIAGLETP